jgi:hypothetical protein
MPWARHGILRDVLYARYASSEIADYRNVTVISGMMDFSLIRKITNLCARHVNMCDLYDKSTEFELSDLEEYIHLCRTFVPVSL